MHRRGRLQHRVARRNVREEDGRCARGDGQCPPAAGSDPAASGGQLAGVSRPSHGDRHNHTSHRSGPGSSWVRDKPSADPAARGKTAGGREPAGHGTGPLGGAPGPDGHYQRRCRRRRAERRATSDRSTDGPTGALKTKDVAHIPIFNGDFGHVPDWVDRMAAKLVQAHSKMASILAWAERRSSRSSWSAHAATPS